MVHSCIVCVIIVSNCWPMFLWRMGVERIISLYNNLSLNWTYYRAQLENGSLYISSVEANRGLTGAYQCLLSSDGIGTIVSRSAIVSISSK